MFIQRDPIGLLGGLNTFQYALNPILWIDVLGLSVERVRAITQQLPASLKQNFKCDKFAQALRKKLIDAKISFSTIELQSPAQIWSLKNQTISTNGFHEAIQVDGYIFDNHNPNGIKFSDWDYDLGITE